MNYLLKNINYITYRILTSYRRVGRKKFNNFFNKKIINIKDNKYNLISGYYDVDLFSKDETKFLFHKIINDNIDKLLVEIYYFDLNSNQKILIDKTNLFCYQFGSRLSWFNKNTVSANTLDVNKLSTTLWKVSDNKIEIIKKFNKPIYSWSKNQQYGAVINMKRLAKLRDGYGYSLKYELKSKIPKNDGLEIIDYSDNKTIFFLSIKDICCDEFKNPKYKDYYHYISHLVWNSDSSIIMFDYVITNLKKRFSKLCFFNLKLNKVSYWDLVNTINVSHFTWINNKEFIVSSLKKNKSLNFFIGNYNNNKITNLKINKGDGHPVKYEHMNKVIIDSYPDRFGEQTLYDFDLNDYELNKLAKFFSPIKFSGSNKCDLHPKLSTSGKYIGIDCCFNSKREIIIIKAK